MQVAVRSAPLSSLFWSTSSLSEIVQDPRAWTVYRIIPPLQTPRFLPLSRPDSHVERVRVSSRSPEFPPREGFDRAVPRRNRRDWRQGRTHRASRRSTRVMVYRYMYNMRYRSFVPCAREIPCASPSAKFSVRFSPASRGNRDHASPNDTTIVRGYRIGRSYRFMSLKHSQWLSGAGRGVKIDGRDRFKKD